MNRAYDDLLSLTDQKPCFFQSAGVPRWGEFRPGESTDVYARECAIAEIACQSCDTRFHVLFERRSGEASLADEIRQGTLAYRDPPNVGCCASGPTMTSETVRTVEYWAWDRESFGWVRDASLETAFRRFGDPWTDQMRARVRAIADDPSRDAYERQQAVDGLAADDERRAAPTEPVEPAFASDYLSGADEAVVPEDDGLVVLPDGSRGLPPRDRSRDRYFVRDGGPEEEVDAEEFVRAENRAGFRPKPGCGPFATGGFSSGERSGRVETWFDGPAVVLDGDTGLRTLLPGCREAYDEARRLNGGLDRQRHWAMAATDADLAGTPAA